MAVLIWDCACAGVGAMKVVMADPKRVAAATRFKNSRRPLEKARARCKHSRVPKGTLTKSSRFAQRRLLHAFIPSQIDTYGDDGRALRFGISFQSLTFLKRDCAVNGMESAGGRRFAQMRGQRT